MATTIGTRLPRLSGRRLSGRRLSGRRLSGRVVLLAALTAALCLLPIHRPAQAATMFGHDVSWPQCPVSEGGFGLPMPPASSQFIIIGLTRGLAFTENPCLDDQVQYARSRQIPTHAYTMATWPTAAQLATYGAAGPWVPSTRAGQLSNVGYAEARFAVDSIRRIGWAQGTVWIDVEPRPAQPWPTGTAAQQLENRYVIEGLMRGLREAGLSYGLYSYTSGWQQIVGNWRLPPVPVWATAGRLDYPEEALDRCTQPSFSGGRVYLSQWYDDTRDYDRTCGTYAFTRPPVPPPTMTWSMHDFTADWKNDVLAVEGSGRLLLYPGDERGGLTAPRPLATDWTRVVDMAGVGDFTGDGRHDVLVLGLSGTLWLSAGTSGGAFAPRTPVATGWSGYRALAGPGDLTGDGHSDLLAIDRSGALFLFPGTDRGTLGARRTVATGWDGVVDFVGIGDATADRVPDIVVLGHLGGLYLYPGDGSGGLGTRSTITNGWPATTRLLGPGDVTGDRRVDLMALDAAGTLRLHAGLGGGRFAPRVPVAADWLPVTHVV